MTFKKLSGMVLSVVFTAGTLLAWNATASADRTIKLAGFGVKSGVVRSFGINTEAVLNAAVKHVNESGGVKLGDGTSAQMELVFHDDRCKAEEGISVLRRIAGTEALVAIGPTCSNVAEPLFGILQKKVGDAGDSGLQMPIFTDTAIKGGLAKISEWASGTCQTRASCTRICLPGSDRSIPICRPFLAVWSRILPIHGSPGTRL